MHKNKYATLDLVEALGYTAISRELANDGHALTPARTRLILMSSLEKILKNVAKQHGKVLKKEDLKKMVQDPDFQNIIAPFIQMAYE
jgi:hypothetical protein